MKIKYTGCSNAQVIWGSGKDPRDFLVKGIIYDRHSVYVHTWHTLFYIEINGKAEPFNSVCFEIQKECKR